MCTPAEPERLWDRFATDLSDDYLRRAHLDPEITHGQGAAEYAKRAALADINDILIGIGSSLAAFTTLPQQFNDVVKPYDDMEENENDLADLEHLARDNFLLLDTDQRRAFDTVMNAVQGQGWQRLLFVNGPGGTGKSLLYNTLIADIQGRRRKHVVVTASFEVAALIVHGSRTARSTFKVPIPILRDSSCSIKLGQDIAAKIREADAIFWGEDPMQD
ncbi:PIF1-like helicase-domain-containing protein [Dissophora ornata]|nr:PIF1-like helicase-domain-containing protein [Dissophora ornata]